MVSITHVAATRTVIATDGVPVQGNLDQVASQLLATMADDAAAWSAPLMPTQPLSPPSPYNTSKQEDKVNSLPPVCKFPPTRPHQKMKIIPLIPALADQTDSPTCSPAYRPPPLSPIYQPLDLIVHPHYYSISRASHNQSTRQNPMAAVPPHYSP